MTTTDPRSSGENAPDDQRQLTLVDVVADPDRLQSSQCQAISTRHSRQCQHDALPGIDYCATHWHLFGE